MLFLIRFQKRRSYVNSEKTLGVKNRIEVITVQKQQTCSNLIIIIIKNKKKKRSL